jgi:prepilin-type N-terminal cleavage/methylation domain-containing protein
MKTKYKGFTLVEITLVMVLISILIAITTPLVSNVVARNDVGSAHESLYNALLRAQQLSKNQYKDSQWRVCLDNTNKQYTITSGTCSDPTNVEIIKIASNITISSEQTLDILFTAISGELDNTTNSITVTLTGGGASKSILINPSGVIDKEANTTSVSTPTTPSIVTDGLVLNLDAGNINSYPGLSGNGNTWFDLSGNNNGTLINGVGYNSTNGGSLVFDGVNDTINFGDILDIGLSDLTVSTWINSTTKHFGRVVSKNNAGADGWWLAVNTDGSFGIGIDSVWSNSSVYDYDTRGWINLVGVWNRSSFAGIYVNAVNLGNIVDISSKSSTNLQTSFNLRVSSRDAGGGWFNGNISKASIYNRALTPEEIQQNFNATKDRFGL